ncbi:1-acyl-sn-glycerol-3-phosphate acyltransferase [Lacinutrix salivirga]
MKQLWLHSVRAYLRLGLFFYYKKIEVHNTKAIPKNTPILFLANHQNALIDPLLIATQSGVFSYYLTRAAVFKKPLVKKILNSLQMLPVYRIRDGWSNLSNNTSVFSTSATLLHQKNVVTIFPEGSHNIKRSVRPLSKGFTRIVFETLESYPDTDLHLIPIGFNYKKAEAFADSTAIYFGNPIAAKDYLLRDKNEAIKALKEDVQLAISELTTHIPLDNYEQIEDKLEQLHVNYLRPKAVNVCIQSSFKNCELQTKQKSNSLKKPLKVLLLILLFFPYFIWKKSVAPKVEEIEFIATFRFAVSVTLVPIWIVLITVLLGLFYSWTVGIVYLFAVLVIALLAVKL